MFCLLFMEAFLYIFNPSINYILVEYNHIFDFPTG